MQDAHPDTLEPDAVGVRARLLPWLWPAAVALVVVAVTAAFGGFERAPAHLGPRAELGQTIETRHWDYTVHRVAVTGKDRPAAVVLRMTIRSKLTESRVGITPESIVLKMADETLLSRSTCLHNEHRTSGDGTFDPFVATEALCVFDLVLNNHRLPADGPPGVRVVVLDQGPPANDFERKGEPEVKLPPVAHIPVTAEWLVA